ncbi:MAG TPA: CRISPR-associated protein Csx15 [bacterium]|nr:CRISPR-associated protein Csx15 [bacterium]
MIILNFSHPLNEEQVMGVASLANQRIERVVDIGCNLDHDRPFAEQMEELILSVPLTTADWQNKPILINLPSLNYAAAVLLAQLHGLMGYFPPCMRLKPKQEGIARRFEPAELLNLQVLRDKARSSLRG